MSTINTNGINTAYPTPGINNNSQGFRDNFTSIKNNLTTAGTEITDLQNKVVLKAALSGTTLNNNMANALISNASVFGFRTTTYNLGGALAGTVAIDTSLADVHYGTVAANSTLSFTGWAPIGTQRSIEVQFGISNTSAIILFPPQVVANNNNYGTAILENANIFTSGSTSMLMITPPANTTQLNYRLSSSDCGNTIYIEPLNRPYQSTQAIQRSPPPTGIPGDKAGAIAVDADYFYVCVADFSANIITLNATETISSGNIIVVGNVSTPLTPVNIEDPIIFSGNVFGNVIANTVYFIGNVVDSSHITITANRAGSEFDLSDNSGNTCSAIAYHGANVWKRTSISGW